MTPDQEIGLVGYFSGIIHGLSEFDFRLLGRVQTDIVEQRLPSFLRLLAAWLELPTDRRLAAGEKLFKLVTDVTKKIGVTEAMEVLGQPTIELIMATVAQFYSVNMSDLKSRDRHRVVALPRAVAMYLTRRHTAASYHEIGRRFGKDHSTVVAAVKKIERLSTSDTEVRFELEKIRRVLNILSPEKV